MTDAEAAADAFDALSDPTRVAILRELVSQFYEGDGSPVGFAELRRAVGIDDPGRFNYHLDTLRERFVVKHDEGYAPTVAGLRAIESAEAGVYTDDPDPMVGTVDYGCPECAAPLTASYENRWISVACDDHGTVFKTLVHSSVGAEGSLADVIEYAAGEMWRRLDRTTDGVCPVCRGAGLSLSFREVDGAVVADCVCDECYFEEAQPVVLFALSHPSALSLLRDRGFDVPYDLPFESFDDWIDDTQFVDDGRAVDLTLAIDGDGVTVRVAGDLTVETV